MEHKAHRDLIASMLTSDGGSVVGGITQRTVNSSLICFPGTYCIFNSALQQLFGLQEARGLVVCKLKQQRLCVTCLCLFFAESVAVARLKALKGPPRPPSVCVWTGSYWGHDWSTHGTASRADIHVVVTSILLHLVRLRTNKSVALLLAFLECVRGLLHALRGARSRRRSRRLGRKRKASLHKGPRGRMAAS